MDRRTFDGIPLWESFADIINSHNRVAADSAQAIIDVPEEQLDKWYYCKQCDRAWEVVEGKNKPIRGKIFFRHRLDPKPCRLENCK